MKKQPIFKHNLTGSKVKSIALFTFDLVRLRSQLQNHSIDFLMLQSFRERNKNAPYGNLKFDFWFDSIQSNSWSKSANYQKLAIVYHELLKIENDQNEISIMYGFAHSRGFRIILSHFNGSVLRGAMTTNINVFCTLRRQISPVMAFWTIYIYRRIVSCHACLVDCPTVL